MPFPDSSPLPSRPGVSNPVRQVPRSIPARHRFAPRPAVPSGLGSLALSRRLAPLFARVGLLILGAALSFRCGDGGSPTTPPATDGSPPPTGPPPVPTPAPMPVPVCDRTPEVRDGILALLPTNDCAAVTSTDLQGLSANLNLRNQGITALQSGDFAGLASLWGLDLGHNRLGSLPAGILAGLVSLAELNIGDNSLRALPAGVFDDLESLQFLSMGGNPLGVVPPGLFDGLDRLQGVDLSRAALNTLPPDLFGQFRLTRLNLSGNSLDALPAGLLDGQPDLSVLALSGNGLRELSAGAFNGLGKLWQLHLQDNELTGLPAGAFADLGSLEFLHLERNELAVLPAGVFIGLARLRVLSLQENPGAPFELRLGIEELSRSGATSTLRVELGTGTPFAMPVELRAENASLSTSRVTIPAGEASSEEFTVTEAGGSWSVTASGPQSKPNRPLEGVDGDYRGLVVADAVFRPR